MTLASSKIRHLSDYDILRRSGRIVTGEAWPFSRCGKRLWNNVRAHACAYTCMKCVCLRGMELCNGYRFWTLESRLMNTKHVNSRGKSVEWAPSFSFGRCLRSIEEADVEARSLRPLTRKTAPARIHFCW